MPDSRAASKTLHIPRIPTFVLSLGTGSRVITIAQLTSRSIECRLMMSRRSSSWEMSPRANRNLSACSSMDRRNQGAGGATSIDTTLDTSGSRSSLATVFRPNCPLPPTTKTFTRSSHRLGLRPFSPWRLKIDPEMRLLLRLSAPRREGALAQLVAGFGIGASEYHRVAGWELERRHVGG